MMWTHARQQLATNEGAVPLSFLRKAQSKSITKLLPWLGLAFVFPLCLQWTPSAIPLAASGATLFQIFPSVLFVSLLLERALEVFVNAWRCPEAAQHDLLIRWQGEELARLKAEGDPTKVHEAIETLKELRCARSSFKAKTHQIALGYGMVCGVCISAVGIRTLHILVDSDAFGQLSATQAVAFRVIDVLLTGGLIAGGSEGIHNLAQVFTNFLQTTAEKARAR